MQINDLTKAIIGAAIEVHRRLGPGLLESAYRVCLAYELRKRGFEVVEEKPVPVIYDKAKLECGFRADLLVNGFGCRGTQSQDGDTPGRQGPNAVPLAFIERSFWTADQLPRGAARGWR